MAYVFQAIVFLSVTIFVAIATDGLGQSPLGAPVFGLIAAWLPFRLWVAFCDWRLTVRQRKAEAARVRRRAALELQPAAAPRLEASAPASLTDRRHRARLGFRPRSEN